MTTPLNAGIGLKTRHVFLDTQVYRQYGHNLNTKVLRSLLQQVQDHVFTLHITDITKSEIERQIGELAIEAAQAINKGNKERHRWEARSAWPTHQQKTSGDVSAEDMKRRGIQDFNIGLARDWRPTEHRALDISPKELFEKYFAREPPFEKADSKEFPDAFVIAALDRWCVEKHERMYVVTRDDAMKRAAEKTETLLPLSSLDELLEIMVQAQDPKIIDRVQGIFESAKWDTVEERLRDGIGQLGTVYIGGLQDGEVIEHFAGNDPPKLDDFHVISVSDEQIEVIMKVKLSIEFTVQFLDTSLATYDSEDQTYIGAEKETETFEQEKDINVFVVVDAKDDEIVDVDILTRDLYLEEPYEDYK